MDAAGDSPQPGRLGHGRALGRQGSAAAANDRVSRGAQATLPRSRMARRRP